jgi:Holliday junction resolvase-like predicted endonuclease
MSSESSELVQAGKYTFRIGRHIQYYRDEIIVHTYKVGGDYADCVNISYRYENNVPVQVKIPHLLYEPECATDSFLESGSGTEIMIKTSIRYSFQDVLLHHVKTLPNFEFEDDSHLDCVEKNMKKLPPRKQRRPLNLAYFYIAYHGKTWYEARFNAKMIDSEKYKKYRQSLDFLTDPRQKVEFVAFLQIIGQPVQNIVETYYRKASTYRDFFEAIPKTKRCELLSGWLYTFMNHYIGSTFSDKGWFINVHTMDTRITTGGPILSPTQKYRIFSYKKTTNF